MRAANGGIRHALLALAGAVLVTTALPGSVTAQGVCAAPHSTGGLGASASVGTLPPGAGWVQVSGLRWVSDEFFSTDGEIRPLLADGVVTTNSVYFTGSIGVINGVEAYLQAPVHFLDFEDQTGRRTRTGLGDIRGALRISPSAFGVPVPVIVRAGVKVPGSDFPVDATIIPLTEGQTDWELSVEYGRNLIAPSPLAPATLYGVAWVGYRWRELNEEAARRPGDELFAHAALGGFLDPVDWELGLEVVRGQPPVQQGFRLDGARRELVQLTPAVSYEVGPGRAGVSVQLPVNGRNLPTGPSLSVSYLLIWGGL